MNYSAVKAGYKCESSESSENAIDGDDAAKRIGKERLLLCSACGTWNVECETNECINIFSKLPCLPTLLFNIFWLRGEGREARGRCLSDEAKR